MHSRKVHVLLDDSALTLDIANALDQLHADVRLTPFSAKPAGDTHDEYDVRLVVTSDAGSLTNGKFERLLRWCNESACATLIFSTTPQDRFDVSAFDIGDRRIGFACDVTPDELVGRLAAMCSVGASHERHRAELGAVRCNGERQQERMTRLEDELRSARILQRSMRRSLPKVRGAEVGALQRAATEVSGDIYDVVRVDESQVAMTLLDVTDHGLASAILAAYVQRSVQSAAEVESGNGRLDPARILARTNRDILESHLEDCQFVTAVCAIYDEDTGMLRWARGGAPYPILLRPGRRVQPLTSDGPLLGVLCDAEFETGELQLEPGDTVVFHTDGLDSAFFEDRMSFICGTQLGMRVSASHCDSPVSSLIDRLDRYVDSLDPNDPNHDDVTVIVLRVADGFVASKRACKPRARLASVAAKV